MQELAPLLDKCRARGIKLTPQRIAIFECLAQRGGHPSAEEVFHEVSARHPTLSFATVYNTLELLTELGEVREVIVDELRRRYDLNTEPHHHAVCRQCHRIVDVPAGSAQLHGLSQVDLSSYDFACESTELQFTGLCGPCVRAEAAAPQD